MVGSSLRQKMGRVVRTISRSQSQQCRQPLRTNKHHEPTEGLIERFKQLTVETVRPVVPRTEDKPFRGVFFQKRHYFTCPIDTKRQPDKHHLNEYKQIKAEILEKRRQFLQKHNLLQDEMLYLDRIVYANRHLYNLNQKDALNRTNLERMHSGLCPIDLTGNDIIIIHHFDQTMRGPWVILTNIFHRDESEELHSYIVVKDRVNRKQFGVERANYWKFQAQSVLMSDPESNIRSTPKKQ